MTKSSALRKHHEISTHFASLEKFQKSLVDEANHMPNWEKFVCRMNLELQHQIPEVLQPPTTGMNVALFSEWKFRIEMMVQRLIDVGWTWNGSEPAHSIGHVIRDLVNTSLIVFLGKYPYRQLYIGGMAGVFHDFSTAIVKRYHEEHRALRHGTATALLLDRFVGDLFESKQEKFDLKCLLIAVAGHTNEYATETLPMKDRKPKKVEKSRFCIPVWPDFDQNGAPHLFMHLPRQIDRLENCGATHFARHYLTLVEEHKDQAHGEFVVVNFANSMRGLLRPQDVAKADPKKQTILEHVRMYADSQTNASPFGKWDYGFYCVLRDAHRKRAYRMLHAPKRLKIPREISVEEIAEVFHHHFLYPTIEPTKLGYRSAELLFSEFNRLSSEDRSVYAHVFAQCMIEYVDWYDSVNSIVANQMPKNAMEFVSLQNIIGSSNIMDVLKPSARLMELISKFNFVTN
ncbi:hypothetical protein IT409_00670 [Candidatus Falkowbacteria bacterium]|nr:hypothetical protein [Candidatus Falkowbacteria bacterium]